MSAIQNQALEMLCRYQWTPGDLGQWNEESLQWRGFGSILHSMGSIVWAWRTTLTRRRPCWRCTSPQQSGSGCHCLLWCKRVPGFHCSSFCTVQWSQCSSGGWWCCQLEPGRWCWCKWCCDLHPGKGTVGRAQLGLHSRAMERNCN